MGSHQLRVDQYEALNSWNSASVGGEMEQYYGERYMQIHGPCRFMIEGLYLGVCEKVKWYVCECNL